MCLSLVACGDKAITKLTIDEGLSYTYALNSTPDFSAVKATVTYNDDTTVSVTAEDLEFSTIDTTTAGTKQLTITYQDFSITVDVTVEGTSLPGGNQGGSQGGGNEGGNQGGNEGGNQGGNEGGNQGGNEGGNQGGNEGGNQGGNQGGTENTGYEVMGVEMPKNLVTFSSNSSTSGRFTVKKDTYKVGNANPFVFRLSLTVLDENDNIVPGITKYTSVSVVYLVDGQSETQCTDGTYVTIDEANNSFKFTDAAVGKTFRIQTRPEMEGTPADLLDCTRSLQVEVVAGYNVTNAKELNLMTNKNGVLPETQVGADNQLNLDYRQVAIVKEYVDLQFGQNYYNTYGGDNMKGIVLHCDLTPTLNDIPGKYITRDKDGNPAFDDAFEVYTRELYPDSNGKTSFDIYGNYFTINTANLPLMTNDPELNGGLTSSNAQIFNFECWFEDANGSGDSTAMTVSFDYKKYPVLIENIAFKNNDPHSDNVADNERHKFSLAGIRIKHVDITMDNTIMEAFSTSFMLFDCNTELTIKDSQLNNAWMTHLYARAHNDFQNHEGGPREQQPYAGVTPIEVNVINSKLTKCGGPVIMTHSAELSLPYNKTVGLTVNVDNSSELWSYVTGEEAWFQAYEKEGALEYAKALKAMAPLVQNAAATFGGGNTNILTTRPGSGDTLFMNIVFCSLSGNSKYIVDGTTIMDNTDEIVTAYMNSFASYGAPLMQSTVNPTATATYFEGAYGSPADKIFNPNFLGVVMNPDFDPTNPTWLDAAAAATVLPAEFFQGEYLNFHMGAANVSVVMGYYH